VADLLGGGEVGMKNGSIVDMKLVAERSSQADGAAQGFGPVSAQRQPAAQQGRPPPPPRK